MSEKQKNKKELPLRLKVALGIGTLLVGGWTFGLANAFSVDNQRTKAEYPSLNPNQPALVVGHHVDKAHLKRVFAFATLQTLPGYLVNKRHVPDRYYLDLEQHAVSRVGDQKTDVIVTDSDQVSKPVYEHTEIGSEVVENALAHSSDS